MKPYLRQPPKAKTQNTFTLSNFGGGLNNVNGDTTIADNQATDCKNMMFISDEIMEKRYGTTAIDDLVLEDPITWIDKYRPTIGEAVLIRATDSEIYVGDTKLCDVEGRVSGVNYIGKYYFVDGKKLMVYDGTTYYKICVSWTYPTEDVAANATSIKVKYIPDYVTTDKSLHVILADGTKATLSISGVDRTTNTISVTTGHTAAIPKETGLYFYVPLSGETVFEGTEVWDSTNHYAYYEPCENQLSDDFAGTPYLPDLPDVITIHKDRIFIAGDSEAPHNVYMSSIVSPLYFPAKASVSAKPDGNKIVALIVFDSALIIARHTDIYVLYGSSEYQGITDDPFYIKQMDVSIGLMSSNCYAILHNFMFYLGYDGRFYKLNTPTTFVEYLMTRPLTEFVDLFSTPLNLTSEDMKDISAVAYNNEYLINIRDKTLVYSYRNQAFTYYEGLCGRSLYTNGVDLYIGRSDGRVAIFDKTVYSDLGVPIEAIYETKRFDLNSPINYKYFLQCLVSAHAYDDYRSSIQLQLEVDFYYKSNAAIIYNKHPINSNLSNFNVTAPEKLVSAKNIIKSEWIKLNYKGRTIKFKYSNNMLNEPMRVYDINLVYTDRDIR